MFRSTSIVISMLLLCLLFIPAYSVPINKSGRNRSSPLNRQKRTFNFGLFGSRDWSPFYQSWRVPTFSTVPNVVHLYNDEELYGNIIKKISDLEIGQNRIINYLEQLHDDKNANPCEVRRTEMVSPTSMNVPQLAIDADLEYRKPLTTTTTTTTTTTISAIIKEEPVTELPVEHEATSTSKNEQETSAETSSEEHKESAETDNVTTIPMRDTDQEFTHLRVDDFTEKNDVL